MVKKKTAKKKATKKKPVATKKPVKKTAKKVVKKTAKKPVKKTAKKVAKKAAKKTVKKAVKKVAKKKAVKKKPMAKKAAAKKAVKKVAKKKPVKIAVKKVAKKAAKKTIKKSAKKAVKKVAKRTVKKTVTKPVVQKAPPKVKVEKVPSEERAPRRAFGSYGGIVLCEDPSVFPEKSPYPQKDLGRLRELLEKEHQHLLEVLRELDDTTFHNNSDSHSGSSPSHSTHLFEGASENMTTETALLVRRDEEAALVQVNAALDRMSKGLFGVCVACASKIGMPRLRAKPDAHLCIKCITTYDKKSSRR